MNKQAKIRQDLATILEASDMILNAPNDLLDFIDKEAIKKSRLDQVIKYLHSQGMMLQSGTMTFVVDSCTLEMPTYEPLIEVKE